MFKDLVTIFLTFLKIGAFTIGGAYAMIPLIRREVCQKRKWISEEDFLNGLAAAQSCPGPIAINLSIYIGLHVRRGWGMTAAVLGTVLPSLISITIIAALFNQYAEVTLVRKAFHGLKPALVALIAVPLVQMTKNAGLGILSIWVPITAMLMVGVLGVSPVYLILLTITVAVAQSVWLKGRLK